MNKVAYNDCYGIFSLSREAIDWIKDNYPDYDNWYFVNRHDPRLIDCIETLGEKVNDKYSDIKIAEIKGDTYRIEESDGLEVVQEPRDLDWIKIEWV